MLVDNIKSITKLIIDSRPLIFISMVWEFSYFKYTLLKKKLCCFGKIVFFKYKKQNFFSNGTTAFYTMYASEHKTVYLFIYLLYLLEKATKSEKWIYFMTEIVMGQIKILFSQWHIKNSILSTLLWWSSSTNCTFCSS